MMDNKTNDSDFQLCLNIFHKEGIKPNIYPIGQNRLELVNPVVLTRIEQVRQISRCLGYAIGIVGGFVRDLLLQKPTEDVDFVIFKGDITILTATIANQLGGKIGKMSNRTLTTQIRFSDNLVFEFNSTRKERYEYPSRVPIVEEATIIEDLQRRDFTINALIMFENYYLDIFNGTKDLEKRIIQTTRDPEIVFQEDYLRMFRAIRFACRYNFSISNEVKDGIISKAQNILDVPPERIIQELKMSMQYNPTKAFQLMIELDILKTMFPQIKNRVLNQKIYLVKSIYEKIESEIEFLHKNKVSDINLFLAVIFQEINQENEIERKNIKKLLILVEKIVRDYKFSNKEIKEILNYLEYANLLFLLNQEEITDLKIRQFIRLVDKKINNVILFQKAIQNILFEKFNLVELEKKIQKIGLNRKLIHFKLALNGTEIAEKFNVINHEIGEAKQLLSLAIMNEEIKNTKEECLSYLRKYYSQVKEEKDIKI